MLQATLRVPILRLQRVTLRRERLAEIRESAEFFARRRNDGANGLRF